MNFFDTDDDFFDGTDDFMGRAVIFLKDLDPSDLPSDDTIPKPKWYPVKYKQEDPTDLENGPRVLASFSKRGFHGDSWRFKAD